MAKDTFYFSHDYNARSDEKIKLLIRKHGMMGYGVFWSIVEDLYNNANALRLDSEGIAFDLRADTKVVKSVIIDFDLFVIKDGYFGSESVERRLNERNIKSLKASESANKRWEKIKVDANAMRTQCDGNAIKERKGKEIKQNKDNIIIVDIDRIYNLYPAKCPFRNVSTGKTKKNKDKIKTLLNDYSIDELETTIKTYIAECVQSKTYLKNFSTFLNNIPDYSQSEQEIKTTPDIPNTMDLDWRQQNIINKKR